MSELIYNGKSYYEPPAETQQALHDVKIHTFRYYPQDKLMIASDMFVKEFHCEKYFSNTPQSITSLVCSEDAGKIYSIATDIDSGKEKVSLTVRSQHKNTTFRVTVTAAKKDERGRTLECTGILENINEYVFSSRLIEALSRDYTCIYYIDFAKDSVKPFRIDPYINKEYGHLMNADGNYAKVMSSYIKNSVDGVDKEVMTRSTDKTFLLEYLKEKGLYIQDYTAIHNGKTMYCRMKVVSLSENDRIAVMGFADISTEKVRELEKYAYIDPLTNGYNYKCFKDKVVAKNCPGFLVSMDIHGFKVINSVCGIGTGDDILKEIWNCIDDELTTGNIAGHINGDYFAIFINSSSNKDIIDILEKIKKRLSALSSKYSIPQILPYFGITRWTPDNKIELSFGEANSAKNSIRDKKNVWYEFYSQGDATKLIQEKQLEDSFEASIKNKLFEVWYQPKCSPESNKMIGAEALIRWKQRDGSLISPVTFIPLFERNGMIKKLDEYVFKTVVQQQKKWLNEGKQIVPVSINLSRISLYYFNIVDEYKKIIEEAGLEAKYIPIEITESATADNDEIKQLAEEFHKAGFSLHMDDFGSGYSSLALLNTMHFDTLKLDKSLVDFIGNYGGDRLLDHTIALAKELGMHVTAEGVENKKQVDFLNHLDCDSIQGFYYSKPLPLTDFEKNLNKSKVEVENPSVISQRKKTGNENPYLESLEVLVGSFHKILKVNLTDDSYQIIKFYSNEKSDREGYSDHFSQWLINFADAGYVHKDDVRVFKDSLQLDYLRKYFDKKDHPLRIKYRRLTNGEYRWVHLEMIPSKNYEEGRQLVMLYVQDINDSYKALLDNQKELSQFCNRDSLTGLYSFHYFNALCQAYKNEGTVSSAGALYYNIKGNNAAIIEFARTLESNFDSSSCFRISEYEFIVLNLDCSKEKIESDFESFNNKIKSLDIKIMSSGKFWKKDADNLEDIIDSAKN
ncbi:EAL domain-containing protein [Treponema sp.]|uniref:EAL domain-containing protein n=1 Tax=Treponema sp. TaxID=166 RepID=UPI0025EAEED3|nr:EAL domain-containing protein [Treponema sp.]MCR5218318.1 EAL domain-containing protein [Treponema sp.]